MAWATWITLMGSVGLTVLALAVAGPAARRTAPAALARLTSRVALTAAVLGILAVPAVLSDLAHGASQSGGYDYAAAWNSLYDGSNAGLLSGLEVSCSLAAAALLAMLAFRPVAAGRARPWMLSGALAAAAVALGTTKFPTDVSDGWGRAVFETGVWMLHLGGGAIWLGGLAGLLLLALPGGVAEAARGAFWATAIRRFSAVAMGSVAVIALSGLFLFWLHPRVEALRAAGDQRPLRAILTRHFPVVVTAELLLVMSALFVAPFLHGSARNQAFQDNAAAHATVPATGATAELPKIPAKQVSASTWAWGTAETVAVIAVMIAGYGVSGRIARARTAAAATTVASRDPDDLVGA